MKKNNSGYREITVHLSEKTGAELEAAYDLFSGTKTRLQILEGAVRIGLESLRFKTLEEVPKDA
jgi:hypothetical protein